MVCFIALLTRIRRDQEHDLFPVVDDIEEPAFSVSRLFRPRPDSRQQLFVGENPLRLEIIREYRVFELFHGQGFDGVRDLAVFAMISGRRQGGLLKDGLSSDLIVFPYIDKPSHNYQRQY